MNRIIVIGLLILFGCTAKEVRPVTVAPVAVVAEPTKEELEAELLLERRKLELALFEEYVNKETTEMMEFFSVQVGKLMFFKPIALMVSEDGAVGIATCETYVAGELAGITYVISVNDGSGWKLLTLVSKELKAEPTPSKEGTPL
jgi:hypothetical protein